MLIQPRRLTIAIFCFASTAMMTRPAKAGLLDDIINGVAARVQTIVNQATAAANNARNQALQATNEAAAAKNKATEMVDNMQDGLQNLTGEIRNRIQSAVDELKQAIQQELDGAIVFLGPGLDECTPNVCVPFRADLTTLLQHVETLSNVIFIISEDDQRVDLSKEIEFLEDLSPKALFPLYRALALAGNVFETDFIDRLGEVADILMDVEEILLDAAHRAKCDPLLERSEELTIAIKRIDQLATALRSVGSTLNALGETRISGTGGVWGFAGITLEGSPLKRFGIRLLGISETLAHTSETLRTRLQYCSSISNQEHIMEMVDGNHKQVVQNQQEILDAIKAIQLSPGSGADLDDDGDTDLADYSLFQNAFIGGPQS